MLSDGPLSPTFAVNFSFPTYPAQALLLARTMLSYDTDADVCVVCMLAMRMGAEEIEFRIPSRTHPSSPNPTDSSTASRG